MSAKSRISSFSRRDFLALTGAAGAAGMLAGCGVGGGGTATDSKTLTLVADPGGPLQLKKIAENYKKEKGITINFVELPYDGVYTRFTSEFSTQNYTFDIGLMDAIWLPTFKQHLEPLDDIYSTEMQNDFFQAVKDESTFEGKKLGVPVWVNAQILFYRKDLFENSKEQADFKSKFGYDLEPPKTWEQYIDAARHFTRPGLYGTDVKGNVETEWLSTVYQAGADQVIVGKDGKVVIDDEYHLKALQFYAEMGTKYQVTPPGAAQMGWSEAQNLFNQGQTAMTKFWLHEYKAIKQDSAVFGKVGAAPMIGGPAGTASIPGDWHMTIPSGSPKADMAKEFITYVFDHNALGLETDLGLIARRSALSENASKPGYEALSSLVTTLDAPQSKIRPSIPTWQKIVDTVLIPTVQKSVTPGADHAALLGAAKVKVEEIVG